MTDRRKSFTAELKTKVALDAIKGHQTVSEIASEEGVHPYLITQWKKQALEGLPDVFSDARRERRIRSSSSHSSISISAS